MPLDASWDGCPQVGRTALDASWDGCPLSSGSLPPNDRANICVCRPNASPQDAGRRIILKEHGESVTQFPVLSKASQRSGLGGMTGAQTQGPSFPRWLSLASLLATPPPSPVRRAGATDAPAQGGRREHSDHR